MSTAVAERQIGAQLPARHQMTAADIRAQVNLVQEVMQAVMKKDTHYGVIPGTKKPTLYKPGAEVLCTTFRIAVSYQVDDLSDDDSIRYRVRAIATHQTTGIVMGEGIGECSSNEEKYKWRRAVCDEEFDLAPDNRKRLKFSKYQGKVEKSKQIRTEPADAANTILKMAAKRAQVAMTLNVTAASDCFTQDIEDLPEHLREDAEAEPAPAQAKAKPPYPQASIDQNKAAWAELIVSGKKTPAQIIAMIETKATLTQEQKNQIDALKLNKEATDENA